MKNVLIFMITTFAFINANIKAGTTYLKHCGYKDVVVEGKVEDARDIHGELIEKHAELKGKLALLRIQIQSEMRKEKPDWEKIQGLSEEIKKLQMIHEQKIVECMHRMKWLQFNSKNNKNIQEKKG